MKTSGWAPSMRWSQVVPAFCAPMPRKSTRGTRPASADAAPSGGRACGALAIHHRALDRAGAVQQTEHVAEGQHANAFLRHEPAEELVERRETLRCGLHPRVEAEGDVLAAAASREDLPAPALAELRRRKARRLVPPVVVGDRETPQTGPYPVRVRLGAVLGAPREAVFFECVEHVLVPVRLGAAMAARVHAEVGEHAAGAPQVVTDRSAVEPREDRVIVRVARHLAARRANPADHLWGVDGEAR